MCLYDSTSMSTYTNVRGYSDGSCKIKGAGFHPGGWGASLSWTCNGQTIGWHAYDGKAKTTNNEMELMGMLKLVEMVPRGCSKCTLHSDSEYMLKSLVKGGNGEIKKRNLGDGVEFTGYLGNWLCNEWKKADGGDVKNLTMWKRLVTAFEELANSGTVVELKWVQGHSGDKGNEAADTLANLGAAKAANGGTLTPESILAKIERFIV